MKINLKVIYRSDDYCDFPESVTIELEIETLINLLNIKKIVESLSKDENFCSLHYTDSLCKLFDEDNNLIEINIGTIIVESDGIQWSFLMNDYDYQVETELYNWSEIAMVVENFKNNEPENQLNDIVNLTFFN